MTVVDFANKFLFEPIGVEKHINYLAETAEEHKHFTMCKDPQNFTIAIRQYRKWNLGFHIVKDIDIKRK